MLVNKKCIESLIVTFGMLLILYIALFGITVNNLVEDAYLYIFKRKEYNKKYGVK